MVVLSLRAAENPLLWLKVVESQELVPTLNLIHSIEKMTADRDPEIGRLFSGLQELDIVSPILIYIFLMKMGRANLSVSRENVGRIVDRLEDKKMSDSLRRKISSALVPIAINFGSSEQVDTLLTGWEGYGWADLSFNNQLRIVRKFHIDKRQHLAADMLNDLNSKASPLGKVKIENFLFLSGLQAPNWDHVTAEKKYAAVVRSELAAEIQSKVLPNYDKVRSQMQLMEVRSDVKQRKHFLELVRSALLNRVGFSCIRLSDREGYLFPDDQSFGKADVENCEKHWWGTTLETRVRRDIIREVLDALKSADIVGIPSVYRLIRDTYEKTSSLDDTLHFRGLVQVLGQITEHTKKSCLLSEDKFNVALFADVNEVVRLAQGASRVLIVSSVKSVHLPAQLKVHRDVRFITLPTHFRTAQNQKYRCEGKALPFVYQEIIKELRANVKEGTLVLVAGGVIGKIFLKHVKDLNGVGIDIGHTLDDWISDAVAPLR